MKQVNGHGAHAQHGEKVPLSGNDSRQGKKHQERNHIAACPYQQTFHSRHIHIFVGIASVENKGGQFCTCQECSAEEKAHKGCQAEGKSLPVTAQDFKLVFLKIVACQEKRVKEQGSRNTEKVAKLGVANEQSCRKGDSHISRDFLKIRSKDSPKKQRHQIPQRKFGAIQVQPGFLMYHENVQEIVQKFVDKIRNHQLLNQFFKAHGSFGEEA